MSGDGGHSWPARYRRGEPRPALCLLVAPTAGSPKTRDGSTHHAYRVSPISYRLLAGTGAGVAYSGDGGVTWAPTGSGLQGVTYALLSVDKRGTLLTGTDAGLYVSHDHGTTWVRAALPETAERLSGASAMPPACRESRASSRGSRRPQRG